jgi:plastocyanin
MTRSFLITLLLVTAVAATAVAGTIEGKVSPGKSVVYVDAIQGKTFPAPTQTPLVEHRGMIFSPHILLIQQGTTVEFLNSDNVQHNVFWLSINDKKKLGHNLGTWPKGEKRAFKFDQPGVVPLLCTLTRRWRVTSSSVQRRILPRLTTAGTTNSKTSQMASTTWSHGTKA